VFLITCEYILSLYLSKTGLQVTAWINDGFDLNSLLETVV